VTCDSRAGRIILLNGPSSSGKSTLAREVQASLDVPFLHLSSDQLVDGGALPVRRDDAGPFDWVGAMRPRFFDGFHRCIAAMASAGNDLIVDHIIEYAAWRAQLTGLLAGYDVFLVGVHCTLDELERRERARGDRFVGEGRSHLTENRIHELGAYDLDVDTSSGATGALAASLIAAWSARTGPSALFDPAT
jgi:chloramphenicol 3-O phosphotransferase